VAIPEPGPLLSSLAPAPDAIEPLSLERLAADAGPLPWSGDDRTLALRLAYAVADPGILPDLAISPGAIEAGVAAFLAGRPLVVDVRMVENGISYPALKRLGIDVRCAVDAPDVAEAARARGITRSAQAILSRVEDIEGAIVAIGNAPTALLALLDLIDARQVRPALILGFPVGYVAAAESKAELLTRGVPFVTLRGRRGGTPLAVSAVNTLLRIATGRAPAPTPATPTASAPASRDAILLIGHGSREQDASRAMERIAVEVATRAACMVETAYLQLITPTVLDGVDACVARGAETITVMPYFLHSGRHVVSDLPALLDQATARHPGVRFHVAHPLGFSDALADLVIERVQTAVPHRIQDRDPRLAGHTHDHTPQPTTPAAIQP
jgi:precorrin-8X/cobalt-precorrin-8 methylmutase